MLWLPSPLAGEGGFAIAKPGEGSASADAPLSSEIALSADRTPHPARISCAPPSPTRGEGKQRVSSVRLYRPTYRLRHPDRDQRRAGVLPLGAHHARRSPGRRAARRCVAGTRGAIAHGLRLRSPAASAVWLVAV